MQRIEERRDRLTQNNLIFGSSIDFLKNTQTSFFDENFYQVRFQFESAGNLINLLAEPLNLERKNETITSLIFLTASMSKESLTTFSTGLSVRHLFLHCELCGLSSSAWKRYKYSFNRSYFLVVQMTIALGRSIVWGLGAVFQE